MKKNMENDSNAGLLFLLFAGIAIGAIILATRHSTPDETYTPSEWHKIQPESPKPPINGVLYENEERVEFKRGPDRLVEEIIIHRKVTQDG